jgi:hypothetical protein
MAEAPDYFLEIESHFALLRQTPFIFSAKDWALMKSWHESGIPLAVVIEAMDTCFQKREETSRRRIISSLSYCRHAVEQIWRDRKDLYVGRNEAVPETDASSQLDELAAVLRQAVAEAEVEAAAAIGAAADAVSALNRSRSIPNLEEDLMAIEETLFTTLAAALTPEARAELDAKLERQLKSAGKIDEKTQERTRRANERRLLRDRFQIPRLSLFG